MNSDKAYFQGQELSKSPDVTTTPSGSLRSRRYPHITVNILRVARTQCRLCIQYSLTARSLHTVGTPVLGTEIPTVDIMVLSILVVIMEGTT